MYTIGFFLNNIIYIKYHFIVFNKYVHVFQGVNKTRKKLSSVCNVGQEMLIKTYPIYYEI